MANPQQAEEPPAGRRRARGHQTVIVRPRLSLALLATAVALSSCGAATAPVDGPVTVRFVDPQGRLSAIRPLADSVVSQTVRRVQAALSISGVRVTVHADAAGSIGGYGFGGRTFSATDVRLYIDGAFPGLAALVPTRLAWLTAHELHHAARWRAAGYGATLLEAMVSEGMADRYAEELLGDSLPPWSRAFAEDSTAHYLDRARPEFDSRGYNHAMWFFDADRTLPRWTAYTLGYRLVRAHLSAHAGETATTLVAAPASRFRP